MQKEIQKQLTQWKTKGLRIPDVRKFAQKIARENYKDFLDTNTKKTFEEKLLHAFVLGYAKDDFKTLLKYFEEFIPYVDSWAVNDSFCQAFKIARDHRSEVYKLLMKYKKSKKEFESRVVSVTLLSHFLTDEYIDKVIKVLNSLDTSDYYSRMGVAWAVAEIMGKYPEKCLEYMQSDKNNLDKLTYNKALQKMRESFKVSEEIKKITRTLKK